MPAMHAATRPTLIQRPGNAQRPWCTRTRQPAQTIHTAPTHNGSRSRCGSNSATCAASSQPSAWRGIFAGSAMSRPGLASSAVESAPRESPVALKQCQRTQRTQHVFIAASRCNGLSRQSQTEGLVAALQFDYPVAQHAEPPLGIAVDSVVIQPMRLLRHFLKALRLQRLTFGIGAPQHMPQIIAAAIGAKIMEILTAPPDLL